MIENVELALKIKRLSEKERFQRAEELFDRVGLDGFESAYQRELSGGMRQKVGFAHALAVKPELLCLDEPFSAFDVLSAESLRGELLELWAEGRNPTKAILMVSHNMEEAVYMTDRIIVMDKDPGRIIPEMNIDLPHPRYRILNFTQINLDDWFNKMKPEGFHKQVYIYIMMETFRFIDHPAQVSCFSEGNLVQLR